MGEVGDKSYPCLCDGSSVIAAQLGFVGRSFDLRATEEGRCNWLLTTMTFDFLALAWEVEAIIRAQVYFVPGDKAIQTNASTP